MENKKKFLKPEVEIIEFSAEDIILTSNPLDDQNIDEIIEM